MTVMNEEIRIGEGGTDWLVKHLSDSGRLGSRGQKQIDEAVQNAVTHLWGTSAVKSTQGPPPRWYVDISDSFGGEVLYAVIGRSNGDLYVVNVIDDDTAREAVRGKKRVNHPREPQTGGHTGGVELEPSVDARQIESLTEKVRELSTRLTDKEKELSRAQEWVPSPTSTCLLRWTEFPADECRDDPAIPREEEVSFDKMQKFVGDLISKGVKPGHIEIWASRRRPKVTIEF